LLGFDFWASLLTSSMFSTHTLVAYPIVSRLGVSKNRAVAITVGGTILTDTAVLLLLAIILSSSKGSIGPAFWIQLIAALAVFTVIMFYVIPRIAAWFFKKLESERHSHYIFVLLVVFIAAFLAEMAGVEPIIGAFVSGLVLNRLIPHTSVLMNRIEFIGNALFIPFFLISVGMLVDLGVLLNGPAALVIAAVLTAVALLGKWLAALTTKIIYSFSSEEGNLIFGLSSSHAAATLAVILVGFREGLLDENILNGTIILILVTCVVASFVTERSGKVRLPNTRLLFLFFLNSLMSSSRPAINIIYSRPMVEKRSMAAFFSIRLSPWGPTSKPESISPMMPGILSLFNKTGEIRMIARMIENTKTWLPNGLWNSCWSISIMARCSR
jgi:Kef-type K+ transport system membrane component KefB